MKFLVVITSPSLYHGCSTQKKFWEGRFTGKEDLFLSVNMKNCGRRKVRKHKEIKDSDKYFTLNISEKFDSLNKMAVYQDENNVVLDENSVERKPCINIEIKSLELTI